MKKKLSILAVVILVMATLLSSCNVASKVKEIFGGNGSEVASDGTKSSDTKKGDASKKNAAISADDLLTATTREELAAKLGCSIDELDTFLVYAKNLNQALPDSGEAKTEYRRGTTEEGFTWITREEAKSMTTAVVITTENWSEWIGPGMEKVYWQTTDEKGNDIEKIVEEPAIMVKEGFSMKWDNFSLMFIDNTTGEKFEFSHSWPHMVEEENGKFYTTCYDNDGKSIRREFNPADYTCVKANGIIYQCDFPEELLIIQDYDEYEYHKVTEYGKEYDIDDTCAVIVDDPDDVENTICYVGYGAIGEYACRR